ncbi:MAG: multidrug efflux system outer membrane protein [Candidatus Latescibacterota bacterium]|jgi:multidrug efflux system outer membrane protein
MKCIAPLFFALVIGCASAPSVQNPKLNTEIPTAYQTPTTTTTQTDSLWWATFSDSRLDTLIDQALLYNHNLQAASARLQMAQAQAKLAGAPLYPQIGVGLSATKRKQNFIGFPIPGQGAGVNSSTSETFGVSVNASWEIDLWGKLSAAQAAAVATLQASRATYRGARQSLAAQTAKAYFAAVEAKRQVDLAQATYTNNKTSAEQIETRYARGLRSSLDLRISLTDLATAEDRLHQRQQQYNLTVRQLEILLGRYPSGTFQISDTLPNVPSAIPAGLPADLISRRPDLVAAERRFAASTSSHKAAKRARYPSISLTASGGTSSGALGDLLNGDYSVWNLIGNLTQPLFQGGRIQGNINLTKAQSDEALATYAQTVLQAYAEVENALTDENLLALRLSALERATEQALEARRLAEDRYNRGLTDLITMLQTQRTAYQTESQRITVQRLRLNARIDLHLSLGGGFPDRASLLSFVQETPVKNPQ